MRLLFVLCIMSSCMMQPVMAKDFNLKGLPQMGLGGGLVIFSENDKVQHFGAGMFTAGTVKYLGGKWWHGCAAAAAIGALKEGIDHLGNGHVEFNDFLATAAGGCLWFTKEF